MRGRISHNVVPSGKVNAKSNSKKRSLNALSIASHQIQESTKSKHRFGVLESSVSRNKRQYGDHAEDDQNNENMGMKRQKKSSVTGKASAIDSDGGSDSEGNEWKLGQVDSDDDSELDSDQAFGESDEERFDGFAFPRRADRKTKNSKASVNEEPHADRSNIDSDESSLGEDAIDLATMDVEDSSLDSDNSEAEDLSSSSSNEDDDDDDDESYNPTKVAALHDLISNLAQIDEEQSSTKNQKNDSREYNTPSDFGIKSKTKITLEDLGLPKIHDPHIKKSLKILKSDDAKSTKKLEVPLAKRQQDRLDRNVAYEKSKEVLDRWTDTVKHNRRSEHLTFPLIDNGLASTKSNKELFPTNISKPHNDLELTIQTILEESGLATTNGKDDEDLIRDFEELETKKMSIEEIKARRDQLRMARELLFREEANSKRIKKIKSKSYRRVHRKQREKIALSEQEALDHQGIIPSEDEVDARDRKRAEERMGAKHRNNKWAKAMKETGRAIWDEVTKSGIIEMAQKDEELRKRIEGKIIRNDPGSSESSDNEENYSSEDGEPSYKQKLLQHLENLEVSKLTDEPLPGSRLANMRFMRRADAARKKNNDMMIEEMRRDLVEEDSPSQGEEDDIGRRVFGLNNAPILRGQTYVDANELRDNSESDKEKEHESKVESQPTSLKVSSRQILRKRTENPELKNLRTFANSDTEGDAWSKPKSKSKKTKNLAKQKRIVDDFTDVEELDLSKATIISRQTKLHKLSTNSNMPTEDSDDDGDTDNPFLISSDQDLIKRAFAGADVVGDFEAEKIQTVLNDDDKTIDNTLPGWGSWVGDGVSKKELKRNKGRFLTVSKGIKAQNRKDFKLNRVIINEKKVKKNDKYLASSLPHPYESRQQYERSLRIPIGPEWTTKHTFQDATMPRILLKRGIIAPMSNPLL